MPSMNRPVTQQQRKFAKISMRSNQQKSMGDVLNKISGVKTQNGVKFVDGSKHNQLQKNDFLKILTNQLANQDPTNPMDQKKFAADLAQFSQLEQLANMNTKLDKQNNNNSIKHKYYGASFLGKQAITSGTSLDYNGKSRSVDVPFFLPKNANKVMVRVFDQKNQMIAQIEKENLNKGSQSIDWDGMSLDGTPATKGKYSIDVRAWDSNYDVFKGQTKSVGVVTGVSFENGETILKIDGKKSVFLRDVESFKLMNDNKLKGSAITKNNINNAANSYKKIMQ